MKTNKKQPELLKSHASGTSNTATISGIIAKKDGFQNINTNNSQYLINNSKFFDESDILKQIIKNQKLHIKGNLIILPGPVSIKQKRITQEKASVLCIHLN